MEAESEKSSILDLCLFLPSALGYRSGLREAGGRKGADEQWHLHIPFLPLVHGESESITPPPVPLAYPSLGCSWDSTTLGKAKEY